MKFFISISVYALAFTTSFAQNKSSFDGWEFIKWGASQSETEWAIKNKFPDAQRKFGWNYSFALNGMETMVLYDEKNKCNRVTQKASFGVNRLDEANAFYKDAYERMVSDYGKPETEVHDTTKCTVSMNWKLKFTNIRLEYDYKYKIIDEFGAGSYWVEVVFNKAE